MGDACASTVTCVWVQLYVTLHPVATRALRRLPAIPGRQAPPSRIWYWFWIRFVVYLHHERSLKVVYVIAHTVQYTTTTYRVSDYRLQLNSITVKTSSLIEHSVDASGFRLSVSDTVRSACTNAPDWPHDRLGQ